MPSAKRYLPALFLVVAIFLHGCSPRGTAPGTSDRKGFLVHVPRDAEGFLALHEPAKHWEEIASGLGPLLNDPAARTAWSRSPAGRLFEPFATTPAAAEWASAFRDAAGEEMFVMLGPGTAAQLAALQQIKRLFEAARLRNLFTPGAGMEMEVPETSPGQAGEEDLPTAAFTEVIVPLPPAMEEALQRFVREFAIPPVVLGAKIPPSSALPALLDKWVAALPEKIRRDKVAVASRGEFTRVRLPLAAVIPRDTAIRARDMLSANIGDPYTATYIVRDLLAKMTTVSFGRVEGYFLMTVGTHDGLPPLAKDPAHSLAANPAISGLAADPDAALAALFYADPMLVSLAATPPPVGEYLDAALDAALEFAPADRIRALRDAAAPLRLQSEELFRPRISAAGGIVTVSDKGWRAEMLGGSFAPRLAMDNASPLLPPDRALALLWTEHWEKGYAAKLLQFSVGMTTFAKDWFDALGPVFMDEKQLARTRAILAWLQPAEPNKLEEAAGLVAGGLGQDTALALSLDGEMPGPPLAPASAESASLPRIALAAEVQDAGRLAAAWNSLVSAPSVSRWPAPTVTAIADGGSCHEYSIPLGGPDLAPAVTMREDRWILGSSGRFTQLVAKLPGTSGADPSVQSVTIRTAPISAFAAGWAKALQADPTLAPLVKNILPPEPATLSAAAEILEKPRQFKYEARWENETLRRVFELAPAP
ncbi:MAG: hypothetical protein FGM15_03980 [Chthoniobacterales bacterium]|nr:hypothetical protein [Chthoniobacterales bacterium]